MTKLNHGYPLGDDCKMKSDRAKARWAILRSALITSSRNSKNDDDNHSAIMKKHSIHRFSGFNLLACRVIPSSIIHNDILNMETNDDFEFVEYTISNQDGSSFCVRTREKRMHSNIHRKKDLASLMSHVHHGVDNTGQTRVWDSSNTLTYCLFRPSSICFGDPDKDDPSMFLFQKILSYCSGKGPSRKSNNISIVELGAGMAGLPSLALASYYMNSAEKEPIASSSHITVTITDGHPDAVQNNRICSSLTSDLHHMKTEGSNIIVSIQRLLWNVDNQGAQECQKLVLDKNKNASSEGYDIVLVSDCTHFQEFHAALFATIGRLLRVGGMAILCQPHRGNSLKRFMDLVSVESINDNQLFTMKLYDNYNETLSKMHRQYANNEEYNPDIHYPVLLVLQKQRDYSEELDTKAAVSHTQTRDG